MISIENRIFELAQKSRSDQRWLQSNITEVLQDLDRTLHLYMEGGVMAKLAERDESALHWRIFYRQVMELLNNASLLERATSPYAFIRNWPNI